MKTSIQDRTKFVRDNNLCLQCLMKHPENKCNFHACFKCKQPHHHLLHGQKDGNQDNASLENDTGHYQMSLSSIRENDSSCHSQILLSTVSVFIRSSKGTTIRCKALLDSGAQSNFISEKLSKRLSLSKSVIDIPICGINQMKLSIKYTTSAFIESLDRLYKKKLNFLVIDKIADRIPTFPIKISRLNVSPNIRLADPTFHEPAEIDLLLGAETFYATLCAGQIKLGDNLPILQDTVYGWIVSGAIHNQHLSPYHHNGLNTKLLSTISHDVLNENISKFWELEHVQK